ncbi:hypothetical protein [Lysinibacillus sp. FSL W8-0992]|uniref:hypothetical protein n=1 Tax=Lysinibacillus sp. FSL W8-0992 TaxID=2954643 RepID=UPI0030F57833
MKKSKYILTVILPLLIIVVTSSFITKKNQTYSATDILKNANFNAANSTVTVHSINIDDKDIFVEIKLPEETQQQLIEAFKNAKFGNVTTTWLDYDYRINITLNTGHAMFLDSQNKSLTVISTKETYTISNDSDFFTILKKATE